jgi:WD40 repeat protein
MLVNAAKRCAQKIADLVFGFDVFISYAHKDGSEYPERLYESLAKLRYNVFLDRRHYRAGADLNVLTRRYVRKSNTLVVPVGEHALASTWVLREVNESIGADRTVVAIDLAGRLADAPADNALKKLLGQRLYITKEALDSAPITRAVAKIDEQFSGARQETIRLRAISLAAAGLAILGILAGWQWREAAHQRDEAAARLIHQRVTNGTRATLDGDLWGAWAWYANALDLASRTGLDERPHRERLDWLRQQLPHLHALWSRRDSQGAAVPSPDGELLAVYSRSRAASRERGAHVIEIFAVPTPSPLASIALGAARLQEMVFSPGGDELWTIAVESEEGNASQTTVTRHDARSGATRAQRRISSDGRGTWLAPETFALVDGEAAHVVRFRRNEIELTTVDAPAGSSVIAVSPDENLLATYSSAPAVLTVTRAEPKATWRLPLGRTPRVIFSPDGRLMVTTDSYKLAFWRIEDSPRKLEEIDVEGIIRQMQSDRHGNLLLTEASSDRLITTVWRIATAKPLRRFDHDKIVARREFPSDVSGSGGATSAAGRSINPFERWALLSRDGLRLVTVSERSNTYRLWDVLTGDALTPPIGHDSSLLRSVRLSDDGRYLTSNADDGLTKVWDVAFPRRANPVFAREKIVDDLLFLPGGVLLTASGGQARAVHWKSGRTLAQTDDTVDAFSLDRRATTVVIRHGGGFRVLNASSLEPIGKWFDHRSLSAVAVSDDGTYAVSWNNPFAESPHLKLWNLRDGTLLAEPEIPGQVSEARIDPFRKVAAILASKEGDQHLYLYELDTRRLTRVEQINPDGELALFDGPAVGRVGGIVAFDGEAFWTLRHPLAGSAELVSRVRGQLGRLLLATPDGQRAVLVDRDGVIAQVVDVNRGAAVSPEFRHEWRIETASITPDGRRLLTVAGNKAHVWDLETGDALAPVIFHPDTVTAAAIDPTGSVFATASKHAGEQRYGIVTRSVEPAAASAEALVAYGQVSGQQRVDDVGARLPVKATELAALWTERVTRDASVRILPTAQADWLRQRELASRRDASDELRRDFLDRILALDPQDTSSRLERLRLNHTSHASLAAADVEALQHARVFDRELRRERVREYGLLLLRDYDRPSLVYRLLACRRPEDRWDEDGWMFALASYGAGELSALRLHAQAMVQRARQVASSSAVVELKWNAALYAAFAIMLSDTTRAELAEAVDLAERARVPEMDGMLRILKGARLLQAGELDAADAALRSGQSFLQGMSLTAALHARRGEAAAARKLLAKLDREIQGEQSRLSDLEFIHLRYLSRKVAEAIAH